MFFVFLFRLFSNFSHGIFPHTEDQVLKCLNKKTLVTKNVANKMDWLKQRLLNGQRSLRLVCNCVWLFHAGDETEPDVEDIDYYSCNSVPIVNV